MGRAPMTDELSVPDWIPPAAATALQTLWRDHPDPEDRTRLLRLATYELMKVNVWRVLSQRVPGLEDEVIKAAFLLPRRDVALFRATGRYQRPLQPPLDWNDKLLNLSLDDVADHAAVLRDAMLEWLPMLHEEWARWQATSRLGDFQETVLSLNRVADFYAAMDADRQDTLDGLPQIRRTRTADLPELIFSPMMALKLLELYGDPLLPVVTALAEVVFDLKQSLSVETVRSRWRRYLKQFSR